MYWDQSKEKTLELREKQIEEQAIKIEAAELMRGNIIKTIKDRYSATIQMVNFPFIQYMRPNIPNTFMKFFSCYIV